MREMQHSCDECVNDTSKDEPKIENYKDGTQCPSIVLEHWKLQTHAVPDSYEKKSARTKIDNKSKHNLGSLKMSEDETCKVKNENIISQGVEKLNSVHSWQEQYMMDDSTWW